METSPYRLEASEGFRDVSLIVGWQTQDAGRLGAGVIAFLRERLGCRKIGRIQPETFFNISGVSVKNDVARMPGGIFFACEDRNILLYCGDEPEDEWHRFLESLLVRVRETFGIKEVFTINGNPSITPHSAPRRMLAAFNEPHMGRVVERHGLLGMHYEGPPAMSSFLLWIARNNSIPGASIWVDIPFYLVPFEDYLARKSVVQFFSGMLDLCTDMGALEQSVAEQNKKIDRLREDHPQIDRYIKMLENGETLEVGDQLNLTKMVYDHLAPHV